VEKGGNLRDTKGFLQRNWADRKTVLVQLRKKAASENLPNKKRLSRASREKKGASKLQRRVCGWGGGPGDDVDKGTGVLIRDVAPWCMVADKRET